MTNQLFKLFVNGLNPQTTNDGLRQHFEQFGHLTDCVVVQNRCFGFVTYSSELEAERALLVGLHTVDGIVVGVKRAVAREDAGRPEARAKENKILVGGLKDDIEDEHLHDYFSQYGAIKKVEVISKRHGLAFVYFEDNESADKAVVLPFHTINGHEVEVKKVPIRSMSPEHDWWEKATRPLLAMMPNSRPQYQQNRALTHSLSALQEQYQELALSEQGLGEEEGYFGEILSLLSTVLQGVQ